MRPNASVPLLLSAVLGAAPVMAGAVVLAEQNEDVRDENKDLERIPTGARQPADSGAVPSATVGATQRRYLEDAVTLSSQRNGLIVPAPPPAPFDWQERLFFDVRQQWSVGRGTRLIYSGRLNLRAENDVSFPSQGNLINDLREAYASAEPADRTYLDLGRINLKSGVALGYNPTDYFKTRAVVEPLSADPTALRQDRLGTLMLRAEHVWQRGSLTAAFAPGLYKTTPIYTNLNLPSVDPMLDRTNASNRLLLKGSADIAHQFSPELLFYREGSQTKLGTNLTENVGQHAVAYLEWSGGKSAGLTGDALRYGRETGTLPVGAPSVLLVDSRQSFQNELAIGASYTTEMRLTINLEYHFSQAAFSQREWNSWFAAGRGSSALSPVALELWFVRDYSLDQQRAMSRHSMFLRADWVDAFLPKLELTGFINIDVQDGSGFVQLNADYYVSGNWTVGGLVMGYVGAKRSDFGSVPQAASVLFKIARYF
jgi:hypothetical protein